MHAYNYTEEYEIYVSYVRCSVGYDRAIVAPRSTSDLCWLPP